jgi:hypothetical protein
MLSTMTAQVRLRGGDPGSSPGMTDDGDTRIGDSSLHALNDGGLAYRDAIRAVIVQRIIAYPCTMNAVPSRGRRGWRIESAMTGDNNIPLFYNSSTDFDSAYNPLSDNNIPLSYNI